MSGGTPKLSLGFRIRVPFTKYALICGFYEIAIAPLAPANDQGE